MNPTIDTTTHATRIPSGLVGRDYGWEKAVLATWCGVRVLDIDVKNTVRAIGPEPVTVTEIVLTAGTIRDASTLAALLDLPAARTDPAVAWQTWKGWVPGLSARQPVLVTVTAPTLTPYELSQTASRQS